MHFQQKLQFSGCSFFMPFNIIFCLKDLILRINNTKWGDIN